MRRKRCFKCERVRAISLFYRHPHMADGYLGKCKDCAKSDVRANYRKRRRKYRAYDKKRAKQPHRVRAQTRYSKTRPGRLAHQRAANAYNHRRRGYAGFPGIA